MSLFDGQEERAFLLSGTVLSVHKPPCDDYENAGLGSAANMTEQTGSKRNEEWDAVADGWRRYGLRRLGGLASSRSRPYAWTIATRSEAAREP